MAQTRAQNTHRHGRTRKEVRTAMTDLHLTSAALEDETIPPSQVGRRSAFPTRRQRGVSLPSPTHTCHTSHAYARQVVPSLFKSENDESASPAFA